MTNEKLYIIAKKLIPFFPKVENMNDFISRFEKIYNKQRNNFSVFDEESLFKLFVFIYELSQVDSNLNLKSLVSKSEKTQITLSFYTNYDEVLDVCYECEGSGEEECNNCGGDGKVECPECDGQGSDEEGHSCERCDGRGEIECEWCDGEGNFDCSTCDGVGEIENEQQTIVEAYWGISDDPKIISELKKYEGTKTPIPEELELSITEISSRNVEVDSSNALIYKKNEMFVKDIISNPKLKGIVLMTILTGTTSLIETLINEI